MKEIIIGKDTDYEKTITVYPSKGKKARIMMPKVSEFVSRLEVKEGDILNLLNQLWGDKEFEEVILPYVLNLDDKQGRKYLEEECTTQDIFEAFVEASVYLVSTAMNRPDVEEALKKLNAEAPEAQEDITEN